MEKQFVPYELAIRLKELGFNEECLRHYENDDEALYESSSYLKNSDLTEYETSAPLWQQAFDWFVENRNVHVSIEVICKRKQQYRAVIKKIANFGVCVEYRHTTEGFDTRQKTKEKALEYVINNYKTFEL